MSNFVAVALLGALVGCTSMAAAKPRKNHRQRRAAIYMPLSLEKGTITTPEFPVVAEDYVLLLQVEKTLPFSDLQCLLGLVDSLSGPSRPCQRDAVVHVDWTVLDGSTTVAQGSSQGIGPAMYTKEYLFRILGHFGGIAGKKYTLRITSVKDGKLLDVADPQLIVIQRRYH